MTKGAGGEKGQEKKREAAIKRCQETDKKGGKIGGHRVKIMKYSLERH